MISSGMGPKVCFEQFLARPCNTDYIKMLRLWEQLSQKIACLAAQCKQAIRLHVKRQNPGISTQTSARGMRTAFSVFTTHDLIVKAIISYY